MSLVILLSLATLVENMYIEGELNTDQNWGFLGRFCFLSINGKMEYEVEYPEVVKDISEQVMLQTDKFSDLLHHKH